MNDIELKLQIESMNQAKLAQQAELKQLIISVLDDENGVNERAYTAIQEQCKKNNWLDICAAVESADGRYYLGEDDAEDLR